jgi:hypothetical protein
MASSGVDVRLIDPSDKELVAALKRAHAAANRGVGSRSVKLERDGDFWGRFARDCLREREGRRRSCKAGHDTPEVIAGWWTDPANRKHFRIIGRTRSRWGRMRGEGELRTLPPWWQVYPESILAVRGAHGGEPETYLACCRCGKIGTPESLGWMGDTCGPCFDHRADGGQVSRGFGHFSGWCAWQPRIAFSSDSRHLVGQSAADAMFTVNLETGGQITTRRVPRGICALADTEQGFVYAYSDGAVFRWDHATGKHQCLLAKSNIFGRFLLSPDGRRAVMFTQSEGYTADLTEPQPEYVRITGMKNYANLRFSPSGRRIIGLTSSTDLISINPVTLSETEIARNVFNGPLPYGTPHDLVISDDESTVVIARECYYPASFALRVIPLDSERAPYNLPLPYRHRPSILAITPDGARLASADPFGGWVAFWKLSSAKYLGSVRAVPEDPSWRGGHLLFSPSGTSFAVLYAGGQQERGSTAVVLPWPEVAWAVEG